MKLWLLCTCVAVLAICACVAAAVSMPGRSHRGPLPAPTDIQRALAVELRRDVDVLAREPRNVPLAENLNAAAAHIDRELTAAGYRVQRQTYEAEGVSCSNLEVELRGTSKPGEIVIIGAHYDSVDDAPGADDNASGTSALLALARRFAKQRPARTVRFVFFVNEEPPYFKTEAMGSYVYARRSHERGENIVAVLSLETIGYYDTRRGAQAYPPGLRSLYPDTGDFIAFAGNVASRGVVSRCVGTFRTSVQFPAEGAALPEIIQEIGWSDQWSFWQFGWKGLMVTDTAPFRNPHYHRETDLPATLDYDRMARVVEGLGAVIEELGG
jgi:hypothetical protein